MGRQMIYTDLEGAQQESEVWCPGAEFGSVWLVNGALVKVKDATEIAWFSPDFEIAVVDPAVVEYARDILRRWWQSDPELSVYRRRIGLEIPERPSVEEYRLATEVVFQQRAREDAHRLALSQHVASTPVSITRIRELSDDLCLDPGD